VRGVLQGRRTREADATHVAAGALGRERDAGGGADRVELARERRERERRVERGLCSGQWAHGMRASERARGLSHLHGPSICRNSTLCNSLCHSTAETSTDHPSQVRKPCTRCAVLHSIPPPPHSATTRPSTLPTTSQQPTFMFGGSAMSASTAHSSLSLRPPLPLALPAAASTRRTTLASSLPPMRSCGGGGGDVAWCCMVLHGAAWCSRACRQRSWWW
jgi:hypothetical protein